MQQDAAPLDVVIVGGAFAGLAAATYLGRARRRVLVIDAGKPRNRDAEEAHGYLGYDGRPPLSILDAAHRQIAAYPGVSLVEGKAVAAEALPGGFSVALDGGEVVTARKLILAHGLSDGLDPIPGMSERWGKSVLQCPYCHGFEFSGRRLGVLHGSSGSARQACLIASWGPTTLYLNGATLDEGDAALLAEHDVAVEPAKLTALVGEGTDLSAVRLEDGRDSPVEALYATSQSTLSSPIAEALGAAIDDGPLIRTDDDQMTTVPGLYAAGDIANALHSISRAVADGALAAISAHRALVFA